MKSSHRLSPVMTLVSAFLRLCPVMELVHASVCHYIMDRLGKVGREVVKKLDYQ
jgi:hypothetical protein